MPTGTTTPSQLPSAPDKYGKGEACLDQFLTLIDGACKRYCVDVYGAQMANIRNHLWLAFIVLSACAAFFTQSGAGEALRKFLWSRTFEPLVFVSALTLILSVYHSMAALFGGISACTGTNIKEAYQELDRQFGVLENDGYRPDDFYDLKKTVFIDAFNQMNADRKRANERGLIIRSMSAHIRASIVCGTVSILFFLLFELWQ